MNNSQEMSNEILKIVEEASQKIVNSHKTTDGDDSMSRTAQQFMELFSKNLTTAIDIAFKGDDEAAAGTEMNLKEDEEENKAISDVIFKRRQGTKRCKDIIEKTLSIEKKAVMALEVNPGVVNVQEFERQPVPYKKEELKVSTNKTVSSIKSSTVKVVDLNHRVKELVQAAILSKEVDAVEF
ncbi:hypothetical protein DAPPUDRAFT_229608 [Daphnia pulex]|uniref:Uncharacterized protein n=1 Tax=Daphnia pulex TaxID=6669 RepID=E9HRR1_DAPPU|nr:hypothetical protein DAPPUDRAFT_229608 [Daphnia pulex]|eukprot:EFX65579.1 hypothetical protein DAPPUDRAFT_229608 [Daphnia pulex]